MERGECSSSTSRKRINLDLADELTHIGIEAFERNNYNEAIVFLRKGLEIRVGTRKETQARFNLIVAMRAQEIAKLIDTKFGQFNIVKVKESAVIEKQSHIAEIFPQQAVGRSWWFFYVPVGEKTVETNKYYSVDQLMTKLDPISRQMTAAIADLECTMGCFRIKNRSHAGSLNVAFSHYTKAAMLLGFFYMPGDTDMFADIENLIDRIQNGIQVIERKRMTGSVGLYGEDKPISDLLLVAKLLEDKFTALHPSLATEGHAAAEQAQRQRNSFITFL